MEVVERSPKESAVGYFNVAHSYCVAAHAVENADLNCTHQAFPIQFLCFHSLELYLKSYLLFKGRDTKDLSKRALGHNLGNLAKVCAEAGLNLHVEYQEILTSIQRRKNALDSRYLKIGVKKQVKIGALLATCHHLHFSTQDFAYSAYPKSRRPSLPEISKETLEKLVLPPVSALADSARP